MANKPSENVYRIFDNNSEQVKEFKYARAATRWITAQSSPDDYTIVHESLVKSVQTVAPPLDSVLESVPPATPVEVPGGTYFVPLDDVSGEGIWSDESEG